MLLLLTACKKPPAEESAWRETREIFTTANALHPRVFQLHRPTKVWVTDQDGRTVFSLSSVTGKISATKGRINSPQTGFSARIPNRHNNPSNPTPGQGQIPTDRLIVQFERIEQQGGTLQLHAHLKIGSKSYPLEGIISEVAVTRSKAILSAYLLIESAEILQNLKAHGNKEFPLSVKLHFHLEGSLRS